MPSSAGAITPWEYGSVEDLWVAKFGTAIPEPDQYASFIAAEVEAFHDSALFAMKNYFTIESKRGDVIKLNPWNGQLMLHVAIESQRRRGLRQEVVEIKPRQIGWTSYLLGRGLWRAMHPNSKVSIMVIEDRIAEELSKKLATMYTNLPQHMRPMKRIDNLKTVFFDNPNASDKLFNPGLNSSIVITVPSAQRGRTPHFVVASEYAFWDAGMQNDFQTGLVGAMPLDDSACVIIDTTPNGHDDGYEPLVDEAVRRNPKWVRSWERKECPTRQQIYDGILGEPDKPERGYVPAFWPWHFHEQYTTKDESLYGELPKMSKSQLQEVKDTLGKLSRYGNEEETELVQKYGCSLYRIFWRRRKIDSYFTTSRINDERLRILVFRQEFATTWKDCFVDYEQSPFDPIALDYIGRNHVRMPSAQGILRNDGGGIYLDTTWVSPNEELRIYAPPEGTEHYVMGIDTQIAFDSDEADNTVAQVLRVRDKKIVATYTAKVPSYRLRDQLKLIYTWYNNAYYAVETQGIGYGLSRELMDIGMSNTYYWKRLDADVPVESKYPGWQTDAKTRPIMEQALIECLAARDPDGRPMPLCIITDKTTFDELTSVKRDAYGKIKAGSRQHDDHVDALMIALAIMNDAYFPKHAKAGRKMMRREMNALINSLGFSGRSDRNHPSLDEF